MDLYNEINCQLILFLAPILVMLLMLPALFVRVFTYKKAKKIATQRQANPKIRYYSPNGLGPAEVSFIIGEDVSPRALQATLIDLDQRGVITIENDGQLVIVDDSIYGDLKPFEKMAISLYSMELSGEKHSDKLLNSASFIKSVENEFSKKEIDLKSSIFKRYAFIAFAAVVLFFGLFVILQAAGVICDVFVLLFIVMVAILFSYFIERAWAKIIGRPWLTNKDFKKLWLEIYAFKKQLKQIDLDSVAYDAAFNLDRSVSKILPYIIALGLKNKWQQYKINV